MLNYYVCYDITNAVSPNALHHFENDICLQIYNFQAEHAIQVCFFFANEENYCKLLLILWSVSFFYFPDESLRSPELYKTDENLHTAFDCEMRR